LDFSSERLLPPTSSPTNSAIEPFFAPGERTGKFRLGKDQLLVGADGQSHISMEDFAIALVDELEQPKHPRDRFTVGY
jgi:putative NADH-flavin reductase